MNVERVERVERPTLHSNCHLKIFKILLQGGSRAGSVVDVNRCRTLKMRQIHHSPWLWKATKPQSRVGQTFQTTWTLATVVTYDSWKSSNIFKLLNPTFAPGTTSVIAGLVKNQKRLRIVSYPQTTAFQMRRLQHS